MTRYIHPEMEGYLSPGAFTLNDVQYPRVWWRTANEQEIASMGFVEYVPPEPEPVEPPPLSASIVANVLLKVQDGLMNGIETACGFSMAFALGPGSYLLFFTESQPDTAYTYGLGCSSGQLNVIGRDVDYVELLATDGGVPTDPAEISIQINRVS